MQLSVTAFVLTALPRGEHGAVVSSPTPGTRRARGLYLHPSPRINRGVTYREPILLTESVAPEVEV